MEKINEMQEIDNLTEEILGMTAPQPDKISVFQPIIETKLFVIGIPPTVEDMDDINNFINNRPAGIDMYRCENGIYITVSISSPHPVYTAQYSK